MRLSVSRKEVTSTAASAMRSASTKYGSSTSWRLWIERQFSLTWTWNIVIESSSICTRTASFLPPPMLTSVAPSTPDGVLSECVIRLPGRPFDVWPSEFSDISINNFFYFSQNFFFTSLLASFQHQFYITCRARAHGWESLSRWRIDTLWNFDTLLFSLSRYFHHVSSTFVLSVFFFKYLWASLI